MMMLLKTDLSEEEVLHRINLQEPKKRIRIHVSGTWLYEDYYMCPTCGNSADTECGDPFENYALDWCNYCGQKFDDVDEMVVIPREETCTSIRDRTPESRIELCVRYKSESGEDFKP